MDKIFENLNKKNRIIINKFIYFLIPNDTYFIFNKFYKTKEIILISEIRIF